MKYSQRKLQLTIALENG